MIYRYGKSREMIEGSKQATHVRYTYGLSAREYNKMLREQNYLCAMCGESDPRSKNGLFVVDHCHQSMKVRGLLCTRCNIVLGALGDNEDLLFEVMNQAMTYLRKVAAFQLKEKPITAYVYQHSSQVKRHGKDKTPWRVEWKSMNGKRNSVAVGTQEEAIEAKRKIEQFGRIDA